MGEKKEVEMKKEEDEFNVFSCALVPKSRILSEEEKIALFEKYGITLHQLPKILLKDPVSKLLKCQVGDVVEFDRKSEEFGCSKYYRAVGGA